MDRNVYRKTISPYRFGVAVRGRRITIYWLVATMSSSPMWTLGIWIAALAAGDRLQVRVHARHTKRFKKSTTIDRGNIYALNH